MYLANRHQRQLTFDDQHAENVRSATQCALLIVAVVGGGTIGFWLIEEKWDLWRSLFFTLITITTVGYGDEGISDLGRRFAVVLLLCGIGTFTYSLSTLVHIAADRQTALYSKMKRQIKDTQEHIVVCGYGRMGRTVCQQLVEGGQTCVVIENDDDRYHRALEDGHLAVQGVASSDNVLLKSGVKRASGVVCAVDSDAENMFIIVSVRELNDECEIVSRAETESAARKLENAGASLVVSPHQMAGQSIASAMLNPRLNKFMSFSHNGDRLQLCETEVKPDSRLAHKTVQDFGDSAKDVVFVAIAKKNGAMLLRPTGDYTFQPGEIIIFAGKSGDIRAMHEAAETVSAGI